MPVYPNLPADVEVRLKAVVLAAKDVENYLDTDECPYSEGLRALLRRMLNGGSGAAGAGSGAGGAVTAMAEKVVIFDVADVDKYDVLLREVETTIEEMKSIELKLNADSDTSDRIALVKAKTVLLEKWATLKERVLTLKEMSQFQTAVIGVLDEVLDVDQRAQFRERLRGFKSVSGIINE